MWNTCENGMNVSGTDICGTCRSGVNVSWSEYKWNTCEGASGIHVYVQMEHSKMEHMWVRIMYLLVFLWLQTLMCGHELSR